MIDHNETLVAWFGENACANVAAVGGKGASLSEMVCAALPVPPGFVVCTDAFRRFLSENKLEKKILAALAGLDVEKTVVLERISQQITSMIDEQPLSPALAQAITDAYQQLCEQSGEAAAVVAVRSSAAAEDSQAASFAGQQETYLNIFGHEKVVECVRACWNSFFKPRAIYYRKLKGSLNDLSIAVVVQRMLNPDKSGVMFTVDPVQRRLDRVMIEAAWGLGEAVVSGAVTPDNYIVNKADGNLVSKFIARKAFMIVRDEQGLGVQNVELPIGKATEQVLSLEEIGQLTNLGVQIEGYFGAPQDLEWAIEGDQLYILQSRPVTTL